MIETIMYVGIGLLFGCLLAVAIVPLVHNRAVRLTAKRLEGLPQSIAEIQVDKDLLRAEFAMSARRFEIPSNRTSATVSGPLNRMGLSASGAYR